MVLWDSNLEKYFLSGMELFRYKNLQQLEFQQRIRSFKHTLNLNNFFFMLNVVSEELEIPGRKLNQEYRSVFS